MNTLKTRKNIKGKSKATDTRGTTTPEGKTNSDLIDRSKYSLDLINTWIISADSKIGTSCGIVSVVEAILVFIAENVLSKIDTTNGAVEPWRTLFIVSMLLAIITFLVALYFHINALSPSFFSGKWRGKRNEKKKCLIFYEDIKDYKDAEEYINAVKEVSEDQFVDDILREVYCNSDICSKKMHIFKKGLWMAFVSIIMIFACAGCYFQMYHQ